MSKFNFKSQKEVVEFLLSVIRSGESLTIDEENEILRFTLDYENKTNYRSRWGSKPLRNDKWDYGY